MKAVRRVSPFPQPILFKGATEPLILLSAWELTRGEAESYDAYTALVAYNPAWANIPAVAASITTVAFSVDGYLGGFANDADTPSLTTTATFTLTRTAGSAQENVGFTAGATGISLFGMQSNPHGFAVGDTVETTWDGTDYTWTIIGVSASNNALILGFYETVPDTYPEYNQIPYNVFDSGDVVPFTINTTDTQQNGTYYNTTDAEFRKTTDGGTTWTATDITDTLLANAANAVFVPPSDANTSLAMRTYLDTGENYNANNPYYFYNGTEVREVTAFTPSVEAVVKLTNYLLSDNTPSELSFDSAGVMSGTLPLTSRIGRVYFTVDVDVENRSVGIPVRLTPFLTVPLQWNVEAGTDESFDIDIAALQAYGVPLQNLQLSPLGTFFTRDALQVNFSAPVDYTDTEVSHVLTGTVVAAGETVPITLTVTIAPGPQLPSPVPMFTPGNGYGRVSWQAVTGAVTYSVYYRAVGVTSWIAVEREDPTSLTQLISPLTNDVTYEVRVFALSPDYRDSEPQTALGKPTSPPAYFTWLTTTSAFIVDGKTWVLSSTTETQTWMIGNETFILNGNTWIIS